MNFCNAVNGGRKMIWEARINFNSYNRKWDKG